MNTIALLQEQLRANEKGKKYAIITIIEVKGSAPRNQGKMMVYEDGTIVGTIGGGNVERLAITDAKECMRILENQTKTYELSSSPSGIGMTCGGKMKVFIEVFAPSPLLIMCGAGHVGGAVLTLAKFLGFETLLLDDREESLIRDKISLADRFLTTNDFETSLLELEETKSIYVVIATHGHVKDGEALRGALQITTDYVGMIGSTKKIKVLFQKLEEEGFSKEQLQTVFSPIGLDLGGESPEEIAIAIMAEILAVKYRHSGEHYIGKEK